jgi:1,4-dihydroxy-2-naphthoyl-CoA synthase
MAGHDDADELDEKNNLERGHPMAYETIKYEVAEQILTITLNRPDKLNAFNGTMQQLRRGRQGRQYQGHHRDRRRPRLLRRR